MRYTSAEANKLLKSLEDERAQMCMMENQSSVFICAMQENPDEVRPEYGFLETQCEISVIESKIRKVKHAINVFNTTHEVPGFGMTIDQMLVFIPQLSARKRVLSGMAQRLPKARKQSRYGVEKSNFIEYEYANYNTEEARKYYRQISDYLSAAQVALDKLNHSVTMEIDIEENSDITE